jgi:hypothetical protein
MGPETAVLAVMSWSRLRPLDQNGFQTTGGFYLGDMLLLSGRWRLVIDLPTSYCVTSAGELGSGNQSFRQDGGDVVANATRL